MELKGLIIQSHHLKRLSIMNIKNCRFTPFIYVLLALLVCAACYLYSKQSPVAATPITIDSSVSIPAELLDEATLESELGLVLSKRNKKANTQWEKVVKSGALFDCFRPLGEYEFNSGHWVTPGVVTYRNVKGEHLFSFIVEFFHSYDQGQFTFEGVLKENLTLNYSAEGLRMPFRYFSREIKSKRGNCIVPIPKKNTVLPPPTYSASRYRSVLVSYYNDVIKPQIESFWKK